jgi:protein-S-isoprenylcysteine O-methyltransferase Ste14
MAPYEWREMASAESTKWPKIPRASSGDRVMVLLKNIVFTILVPGTVTILIPYWIVTRSSVAMPSPWGMPQSLALVPALLGVSVYVRCVWDFASVGRGTPAPIDPPKVLVVRGLYRYVRNPIYLGVLLVLLGEAVFLESWALVRYAIAMFVIFHLFVVLYEEPSLRRKFGESYERYCRSVRRWIPGKIRTRPDEAAGPLRTARR